VRIAVCGGDYDVEAEAARLRKQIEDWRKRLPAKEKQLGNEIVSQPRTGGILCGDWSDGAEQMENCGAAFALEELKAAA